jgi:hypothetical protein
MAAFGYRAVDTTMVSFGLDFRYDGSNDQCEHRIAGFSSRTPARSSLHSSITLAARDSEGLLYQLGSSLGTGPIPIDSRQVNLRPDRLRLVTVNAYWPSIFSGYRGVIDSKRQASATNHIPNVTVLIGTRLHTAFVTLDPNAPSGIRSISNTDSFTIAK